MPFPSDTAYPDKATLASWNKARKELPKATKTGIGAKLKALEAAWRAIEFEHLNPANPPTEESVAQARLQRAQAAYPQVGKARSALKAALLTLNNRTIHAKVHQAGRVWIVNALDALEAAGKRLDSMDDLINVFEDQLEEAQQNATSEFLPGGKGLQRLHVRQVWERYLLPKVTKEQAEAALQLNTDLAWLVRKQGNDLVLSRRLTGKVMHSDLEKVIEAIQDPSDLKLDPKRALKQRDINAARLTNKQLARQGSTPDSQQQAKLGRKADKFQARLARGSTPSGETTDDSDGHGFMQRHAIQQNWERPGGVLSTTAKSAEAALLVSREGAWLLRKEGNTIMLSARKGGKVVHQDIAPLIDNRQSPKDLRLDDAKALNAAKYNAARLAARQVAQVNAFKQKLAELQEMTGYYAQMDSNGANAKLANAQTNAWVIRGSSQKDAAAWSVKEANRVVHYRITNVSEYDSFIAHSQGKGRNLQVTG